MIDDIFKIGEMLDLRMMIEMDDLPGALPALVVNPPHVRRVQYDRQRLPNGLIVNFIAVRKQAVGHFLMSEYNHPF